MKYCSKCGKELFDEAVICPGCGCPVAGVQTPAKKEEKTADPNFNPNVPLVWAFLFPILGIITGAMGLSRVSDESGRGKCKAAIVLSIVFQIFWLIIMFNMMQDGNF